MVEPHERFPGVYIMRGKDDALLTRNSVPGESVYNEKRVSVEVSQVQTWTHDCFGEDILLLKWGDRHDMSSLFLINISYTIEQS